MYLDYYELSDEPFRVTPDPDFLFLSDQYREAMAAIVYGISRRKGFVCITGEVGVGKTTILRSYLDRACDNSLVFVYIFNPRLSFPALMRTILRDLGQPTDGDAPDLVERLHEHLIDCYRANKTVVLFIDEAQNMPVETMENMRMLSNLETATDKLVQIVLVGQPELDDLLAQPILRPLRNRIVVRAKLHPLSPRESFDYIHHRLHRVALSDRPVFTKAAVDLIVKAAGGVPRVMNVLCDAALITGFGYRSRPVTAKIAREVIADTREHRPAGRHFPWLRAAAAACVLAAAGLGAVILFREGGGGLGTPLTDLARAGGRVADTAYAAAAAVIAAPPRAVEIAAEPAPPLIAPAAPPPAPPRALAQESPRPAPVPAPVEQMASAPPPPKPAPVAPAVTAEAPPPAAPPSPTAAQASVQPLFEAPAGHAQTEPPPSPPAPMVETASSAAYSSAQMAGAYRIRRGDTLTKVSLDIFGTVSDSTLGWLQRHNPVITDINMVYAGQVIAVPAGPDQQEAALRKPE